MQQTTPARGKTECGGPQADRFMAASGGSSMRLSLPWRVRTEVTCDGARGGSGARYNVVAGGNCAEGRREEVGVARDRLYLG